MAKTEAKRRARLEAIQARVDTFASELLEKIDMKGDKEDAVDHALAIGSALLGTGTDTFITVLGFDNAKEAVQASWKAMTAEEEQRRAAAADLAPDATTEGQDHG